jgi:protoporphyrinogen oxidase
LKLSATRFLVIGAGPTGIGAAVRLAELGEDYLVVDASDRLGGMATSITDPEGFTWDLGGHVLHSHFPEFDKAVEISGIALNQVTRNGWVWLTGTGPESLVPTPIQQHLTELPTDLHPDAPAEHLGDYYRNSFGKDLYDRFFEPFNVKMWGTELDLIDHQWTSLRNGSGERNVPTLSLGTGWKPSTERFPYPIGGTGALWQAIYDRMLQPERVRLNTRVERLDVEGRTAELADGTTISYEYCISAAPIVTAMQWSGQQELSQGLRASALHAVGLGYRGDPPPALADKTWLYCPDRNVPWYRATMLSNYDPGNAGPGRWNILCEVPSFEAAPTTAEEAIRSTAASLAALGADPELIESKWHRSLAMGYPVPTLGRDAVLKPADERLLAHGVYSRGRFGGWRYESCNQDYSFMQGREAVDNALYGTPEDVYWHPERF